MAEVSQNESQDETLICWQSATEDSLLSMAATEGERHIVRYANPAFCRLFGKESHELIGRPFAEAAPEGETDRGISLLDHVYRTGEPETVADREHSAEGKMIYWSYAAWPVRGREQNLTGTIIQVTDTTEAMHIQQYIERTNERIREINQELLISNVREHESAERALLAEQQLLQTRKMEGIERLAGGIAHDFNNLLTVILGFTELTEETLAPDNEAHPYLHSIQDAAQRAAALTAQLLAFARKQIIQPKVVDLNALILEIEEILKSLLGETIPLVFLPEQDLWPVKIDPSQFGQVLINLVVNARDAMPHGGELTIQTVNVTREEAARPQGESAPGDNVRLTIRDTGAGIPEELQAHLFEPFFTTKEVGKGIGMGLATCYGIVNQSGGHIRAESIVGAGTTFAIYLPRVEEAAVQIPYRATSSSPRGSEVVFLVEDEPLVRDIAVQTLRRQGYTVFEATNGVEALRLIHDYPGEIDLLVTDVMMPEMSGIELVSRLRMTRPQIKTLYISGYTADTTGRQGILDLGLAFLQKPFSPSALAQKVRQIMEAVV